MPAHAMAAQDAVFPHASPDAQRRVGHAMGRTAAEQLLQPLARALCTRLSAALTRLPTLALAEHEARTAAGLGAALLPPQLADNFRSALEGQVKELVSSVLVRRCRPCRSWPCHTHTPPGGNNRLSRLRYVHVPFEVARLAYGAATMWHSVCMPGRRLVLESGLPCLRQHAAGVRHVAFDVLSSLSVCAACLHWRAAAWCSPARRKRYLQEPRQHTVTHTSEMLRGACRSTCGSRLRL